MANTFEKQITEEGPRNAIVKLAGVLATSDIAVTPAISLSDFHNNDTRMTLVGFRVDLLEYSIGAGLEIQLAWHSDSPQQIYPIARAGRINSSNYGGFIPDSARSGYTGDINLSTTGHVAGQTENFTVILELVKLYKV